MHSADGIPMAPASVAPPVRMPIEPLRAIAGSTREVIDGTIVPTVDQVELLRREAARPLDYWAKLRLDNVRHPPAHPPPYWSVLDHVNRQDDAARHGARNARHAEPARKEDPRRCSCEDLVRPPYAGPTLAGLERPSPQAPTYQRLQTQTVVQRYAATGRLVDLFI